MVEQARKNLKPGQFSGGNTLPLPSFHKLVGVVTYWLENETKPASPGSHFLTLVGKITQENVKIRII